MTNEVVIVNSSNPDNVRPKRTRTKSSKVSKTTKTKPPDPVDIHSPEEKLAFVKKKGMSYVLSKKKVDCTPEEAAYKREYSKYLKQKYISKISPEKYSNYNKEYGKQYYQLHKDDLKARARLKSTIRREKESKERE